MKDFFHKHKWIIGISLPMIILFGVIAYLYFTNRLIFLFNWSLLLKKLTTFEKWLISTSLWSMLTLSIFSNWISSFLYGYIFPSPDKKIIANTEVIIKNTEDINLLISENSLKIDELLKKSKLDSRDIGKYLEELPIKNGKREVDTKIDEWYKNRKITLEEKDLLIVVTSTLFEYNDDLTQKINSLKIEKTTEIAEYLEILQKYLTEGNAIEIKKAYLLRKDKLKQDDIKVLKQSIEATETLYAIEETKELYQELILLEPFPVNYFHFAYFLQMANLIDEAIINYQHALNIYRTLAVANPEIYLPNEALTLNNLTLLYLEKKEYLQALEKVNEALNIYRKLANKKPEKYLIWVANNTSSLAILYANTNEIPLAIEKFEEALKIYQTLDIENPGIYLQNIAYTLNNLADSYLCGNEFVEASERYGQALLIFRKLDNENSGTYSKYVAYTLFSLAFLHAHTSKNEIALALDEYIEALKIYLKLTNENVLVHLPLVAEILNNISGMQLSENEFPLVIKECETALKIYLKYANENQELMNLLNHSLHKR